MTKPPVGKKISLRFEYQGNRLEDSKIIPGDFLKARFDLMDYEKDMLKREFGAALVDFLGIEIQEEDWSLPTPEGLNW